MLFVVLGLGCATIQTPVGARSGIGTGKQMMEYTDPSRPVDPSQVAMRGVTGIYGDMAAALAIGSIQDPNAREAAKQTVIAVSENRNPWGGGYSSQAGLSGDKGRIKNPNRFPIVVVIGNVGQWPIPAGQCIEVPASGMRGNYYADAYKAGQSISFRSRTIHVGKARQSGDEVYSFNITF